MDDGLKLSRGVPCCIFGGISSVFCSRAPSCYCLYGARKTEVAYWPLLLLGALKILYCTSEHIDKYFVSLKQCLQTQIKLKPKPSLLCHMDNTCSLMDINYLLYSFSFTRPVPSSSINAASFRTSFICILLLVQTPLTSEALL